ncbi:MAG: DUF455 family protein [Planctomycetota bacterium]
MELTAFARRVLLTPDLDAKLAPPDGPFTDGDPGGPVRVDLPARPEDLVIAPRRTAPAMTKGSSLRQVEKRALAHHIMANHELQALEVMAAVLLAFPDAPTAFRLGLAEVMRDEQRHTLVHARRAAELRLPFGSKPVNGWIWAKSRAYTSVLDYLAGLPLTFETRNLDHTLEFERYFIDAGDEKGAAILRAIHDDEITHVAFGLKWLRHFKREGVSDWDAYASHLHEPMRPAKSVGDEFHAEPRRAAGLDEDFIGRLEAATR